MDNDTYNNEKVKGHEQVDDANRDWILAPVTVNGN